MKTLLLSFIFAVACLCGHTQTLWLPTTYSVIFRIKNAGISVDGTFSGLQAKFSFDATMPESGSLVATVDVATINTGINMRDRDLQAPKYFDAGACKTIQVASSKMYRKGNDYAGIFKITIKGKTKEMEIPFQFVSAGNAGAFKGSFAIKRSDFGIGGKTLTLSDEAVVAVDIHVKKG